MPDFAAPVERLIDELKHLPGIGQKTAQRLAFHLLRVAPEDALALADAIRDAKEKIRACSVCHNITDSDPCLYCVGPTRSKKTICVVEEAHNIMAIEKTRTYSGMYHVLGGSLSPLSGRGPDQLHIKPLIERLKANRRGDSRGRGPGVCRRSDHVEGHGRSAGFIIFYCSPVDKAILSIP